MKIPDAKAAVDKEWKKKLETNPASQLDKVNSKKEVSLEAQRDNKKVHFGTLMDICHLENAELEPQFQKYKGRVVLRGDIVKTTLEPFQSLLNRARLRLKWQQKKKNVITRVPDCDGQAVDAVSAHTQVKMGDAPRLLRIPKSACPDSWIRLPRHKWPKSWSNIEDPVVPVERD